MGNFTRTRFSRVKEKIVFYGDEEALADEYSTVASTRSNPTSAERNFPPANVLCDRERHGTNEESAGPGQWAVKDED